MKAFVLTAPNGQQLRMSIPPGATPEQIDAKIAELKASFRSSTTSTPTTEGDPLHRAWYRPFATMAGGAVGGTVGALAGSPSVPVSGPIGPYLTSVAGAGLGAGIAGQGFDLAEGLARLPAQWQAAEARRLLGRDEPDAGSFGETARTAGSDVIQGAEGEMLGRVVGAGLGMGYRGLRTALADRAARRAAAPALEAAAGRQGIPLAGSDISQSVTARRIENLPTYFTVGSGKVTGFREGQVAATEGAARRITDSLADAQADAITVGLQAQGGARAAVKEFRQQSQQLFGEINRLAGDEPIVGTSNLRSVAESLVQQGERNAVGSVAPARKLSELLGVSDDAAALIQDAAVTEQIPFAVARQLEAELGDLAFRGPSIGGPRAGQLKALYAAVRSDLDEFLTSPAGNDIAPALAQAKQIYATGKQLFNDSAKRIILGGRNSPLAPEQVVRRAFRPGQIEPTIEFKLLTDDATYGQATKVWLDSVIDKATVQGQFSPAKFATEIARYEKHGHLDVILPPAQAQAVRDVARVSQAITTSARLAGNPPGTAQGLTSVATVVRPAQRAFGGEIGGAAADLFSMTGLPWGVGQAAFSGPGRRLLGHGVLPDMQLPDLATTLGPRDLRNFMLRATAQGLTGALGPE